MSKNNKSAFTLIELSISMVIIGLIVAAVLSGAELIRGSEVKAMISEVQKFKESVSQFQSVYKALPGDITDASTYFTSAANGNGSGIIDLETSNEPFLAIQHLYLAKLLEGSYAGFSGAWGSGFVTSDSVSTGNVPASSGRKGAALYMKCCSGATTGGNYDYSRTLTFKNHVNLFSIYSTITKRIGIVTPIEARDIDKKVDDGVPDTGFVGGSGSYNGTAYVATGCYSGTGSTSTYDAAVAANSEYKNCQMQFAYDWE